MTMYCAGAVVRAICAELGISQKTIYNVLDRNAMQGRRHAIHHPHTDIFDTINTEEKAYWLGFLAADGHLAQYQIQLELASKDAKQVRDFAEFMGVPENVRTYSRGSTAVWVGSKHLVEQVCAFDYHRLTPALAKHFWRGVVDGDGSVRWQRAVTSRRGGDWVVVLVGSQTMVAGFLQFLDANGLRQNRSKLQRSIWRVDYFGREARRIIRLLYQDAIVALERKLTSAVAAMAFECEVAA